MPMSVSIIHARRTSETRTIRGKPWLKEDKKNWYMPRTLDLWCSNRVPQPHHSSRAEEMEQAASSLYIALKISPTTNLWEQRDIEGSAAWQLTLRPEKYELLNGAVGRAYERVSHPLTVSNRYIVIVVDMDGRREKGHRAFGWWGQEGPLVPFLFSLWH